MLLMGSKFILLFLKVITKMLVLYLLLIANHIANINYNILKFSDKTSALIK